MIPYDDALRERLRANLAAHEVRRHALDGRRHAAVSVIVLDSDHDAHGTDHVYEQLGPAARRDLMKGVPGIDDDPSFNGSVSGTAGGAAGSSFAHF